VLGNLDVGILSAHGQRARSAAHVDGELVAWLALQPLQIDVTVGGMQITNYDINQTAVLCGSGGTKHP
jgi:hypothetical protein